MLSVRGRSPPTNQTARARLRAAVELDQTRVGVLSALPARLARANPRASWGLELPYEVGAFASSRSFFATDSTSCSASRSSFRFSSRSPTASLSPSARAISISPLYAAIS
jgi:hypothetical protein